MTSGGSSEMCTVYQAWGNFSLFLRRYSFPASEISPPWEWAARHTAGEGDGGCEPCERGIVAMQEPELNKIWNEQGEPPPTPFTEKTKTVVKSCGNTVSFHWKHC